MGLIERLLGTFDPELDHDLDVPADEFLETCAERFDAGWIPVSLARGPDGARDVFWVRAQGGDEDG